jgi:hypothetical protein
MVVEHIAGLVRAERPHPARPRFKRNRCHLIVSDNSVFLGDAADNFKLVSYPFSGQQIHGVAVYIAHIFCWPKLLQLASKTVVGVRGGIRVFKFLDFAETAHRSSFVLRNAKIFIVKRWCKNKKKCK